MKNDLPSILEAALEAAKKAETFSVGDLAIKIMDLLPAHTAIRITNTGVRVSNSRYFDRMKKPKDIDQAVKLGFEL